MFRCKDKKQNFKADLVRWEPPLDANGNPIGEGFEVRNVRVRIQGTSSVKYPYKNIRIYLTTQQGDVARVFIIGGVVFLAGALKDIVFLGAFSMTCTALFVCFVLVI